MSVQPTTISNRLLASLPPDLLAGMMPRLKPVTLEASQPLYHERSPIDFVYFVEAGMVSLVTTLDDGMQVEVGVIGREGMLGVSLLSGEATSFVESMVQMPGAALQMTVADFQHFVETNASFRRVLLRYGEALHVQTMQTVACNAHHDMQERLARWLLMVRDRADGDDLPLTPDLLAMMLAVSRARVKITADTLRRNNLIRYSSDGVSICDRESLEATSCSCYVLVRERFDILLG